MFKETRGLEYTLVILKVFHKHPGRHDSKSLYDYIVKAGQVEASLTYVQKILPRLTKAGLLTSSESGYMLAKGVNDVTVDKILDLCDMPPTASPLHSLCVQLKQAVSMSSIDEFYDFNN